MNQPPFHNPDDTLLVMETQRKAIWSKWNHLKEEIEESQYKVGATKRRMAFKTKKQIINDLGMLFWWDLENEIK